MRKLLLISVAVIGIAFPATAGAATFSGVVVAKQVRRHALIVTSKTGLVRTVRTHHLATRVGARVRVTARKLADGTFSASKLSIRGRAHRARIHGIVAKRLRGRYLVAAGHSVLAIRTHQSFSTTGDSGPPTGTVVDVTVSTDDQGLDEQDVQEEGHSQRLELEGTIVSVTAPTASTDGEIVLQVGKSTIDVVVPAGSTLPTLATGDSVELKVTLSGTTFTLAQSHDENDDDQGDDDGGGDGSGGGGGDD